MRYILLLLILLSFNFSSLAQQRVSGTVKDAATKSSLAFATIKIGAGGQGVISDLNGHFSIILPLHTSFLEASYLGYNAQRKEIVAGEDSIVFLLQHNANGVSEVIIKPHEEKIRRIINNVIANRNLHNPDLYDRYRCHVYYKMLVDALPPDSLMKSDTSKDMREFKQFTDNQHLLITETYSIRHWRKPQKLQEEILASRFSGFKKSLFNSLVTDVLPFHAYDDFFNLNGKEYPSPISKGFSRRYIFSISDELMQGNDTLWELHFRPRKGFTGLTGNVFILSNGFPVTHIIAQGNDTDLKRNVRLEQQYVLANGKWFPQQLNYVIDWTLKQDSSNMKLIMKGTSLIDSVSYEDDDFRIDKVHTVKLRPNADMLPDSLWRQYRPIQLDAKEQRTYVFMDSLVTSTGIGRFLPFLEKIAEGKVPVYCFDLALKRLFQSNAWEGTRFGLGLQTNEKILKWMSIGGWFGYGTRNKAWKYGAFGEFYLDQYKETQLAFRYDHDISDPGRIQLHPDLNKNYLRNYIMNRADEITSYIASFKIPVGFWQTTLEASVQDIKPLYAYSLNVDGKTFSSFRAKEGSLTLRYAFGEHSAPIFGQYLRTGTKFPIIYLKFTGGQLESGDYHTNYVQTLGALSWQKHFNRIGKEQFLLMGGKIWSKDPLPISKLFSGNGIKSNDYPVYSFGALQTALPYELYTDAFAALYWKHDFDWHLFHFQKKSLGSHPFLSVAHNILYGTLANSGAQQLVTFSVPDHTFQESGIIANDIIRLKYVQAYYLTLNVGYFYHWTSNIDLHENGRFVYGIGVEF